MRKSIYSRQHKALCDALRDARKTAGITQVKMAQALRQPQSFVAKYELGERRLDLIELIEIVDVLNLDLAALVNRVRATKSTKLN